MVLHDITGLFITANRVPEQWSKYHMEVLKAEIPEVPLVTVSRLQMPITTLLDNHETTYANIYRQMLRGAKLVTTPYIAMIEDDTLYCRQHFEVFRPKDDEFAYNRNRWSLFTWGEPTYSIKERISNCSLIAPTKLMIEALEERFTKYPEDTEVVGELGKERTERHLRVTIRKRVDFFSDTSIVQFNHDYASDNVQINHSKKRGSVRAYDVPKWGHAAELVKKFI